MFVHIYYIIWNSNRCGETPHLLLYVCAFALAPLNKREEERCGGDSEKIKNKIISTYRPNTLVL